jgi:DDE superfamily endonuclease
VAAARRAWRRKQRQLDPRQLVFIDETAVATNMVRRYGRAPRGQRLVCKVPFGAWTTLTFIAALRHDRITAPLLLQGAMNGQIFRAYVEQMLAPTLKPGDCLGRVDGIPAIIFSGFSNRRLFESLRDRHQGAGHADWDDGAGLAARA